MSASGTRESRNKRVVERYFHEVLDRKKIDLMSELFAPDTVMHRPGFDLTGLAAATAYLRGRLPDYAAFSTELSGLIAEGDMVSARIFHRARMRPHTFRSRAGEVRLTGERDVSWPAIVQFRLKDGKIVEEWVMRDELGMLAQLGKITIGER